MMVPALEVCYENLTCLWKSPARCEIYANVSSQGQHPWQHLSPSVDL